MYLDPNFGSLIIQLVVALIAGVGAYTIMIRRKFVSLFSPRAGSNSNFSREIEKEVENEK